MSYRCAAATLAAGAVLASACVGPLGEPGRVQHDVEVAHLEAASSTEDGWIVVEIPIRHEGGGQSTWWLGPCEGDERPVTVTGYSGSDVADIPGTWFVRADETAPCHEPAREVTVDERAFTIDTPVVDLGHGWTPLEGTERVELTDPVTGDRHGLGPDSGVVTVVPCDGTTAWTAAWFEVITLTRRPCT